MHIENITDTDLIITNPYIINIWSIAGPFSMPEHSDPKRYWFKTSNSSAKNSAYNAVSFRNDSVLVDTFVFEGKNRTIYPPVEFDIHFDTETEYIELIGIGDYSDVLVYGEDLEEALQILKEEYLPILWEECLNTDSIKMTKRLRTMVNDFKDRVQANDTKDRESRKRIKTKGI